MDSTPERTIVVTGNAEMRVTPDIVQIVLAVETSDKALAKAKAANDERVSKTLAIMKTFSIEPRDVQTDRMNIDARYETSSSYGGGKRSIEPDSYWVRRTIVVTLRDMKRFEDLISATLEAGANRVDGIEFQTTAVRKHRDAARAMALKAAKEKAIAMAAELNCKIGKPTQINEGYVGSSLWAWSGSRYNAMSQNVSQVAAPAASESGEGFAPGQIAVTASVTVTFELID